MSRKTIDRVVSSAGLIVAIVLLAAGGLLVWSHSFVNSQVHSQLSAQKIFFPPKGSPAIKGPEYAALQQYAGQQLVTGPQAAAYADHFIAVHVAAAAGGKTYAEVSTLARANPTDTKLAGQVETLFKGATLRGMLLNAYAFSKFGEIAGIASYVMFAGAGILLVLAGLGLIHAQAVARRVQALVVATQQPREAAAV
jgi:hypothetical protein